MRRPLSPGEGQPRKEKSVRAGAIALAVGVAVLAGCATDRDSDEHRAAAGSTPTEQAPSPVPETNQDLLLPAPGQPEVGDGTETEAQTIETLERYAETFALEAVSTFGAKDFANAVEDSDNSPIHNKFEISKEAGESMLYATINVETGKIEVVGTRSSNGVLTETFNSALQATEENYLFKGYPFSDSEQVTHEDFQKALADPDSLELTGIAVFSEAGEVQAETGPDGALLFLDLNNGDSIPATDPAARSSLEQADNSATFTTPHEAILQEFR